MGKQREMKRRDGAKEGERGGHSSEFLLCHLCSNVDG